VPQAITRREFLAGGWLWLPFLPRRSFKLAGIQFRILKRGRSTRRYLHIHGDEPTAREVLSAHLRRHAGIAHLVKGNNRHIQVGKATFDPNRIFSAEGARKNLRMLNQALPPRDLERIQTLLDRDREQLVRRLIPPPGGLLVALHNNSSRYSVNDEVPISDRVSLPDRDNPHEFVLCTAADDFALLERGPFNAVLQRNAPPEDDGSFSRLAAARGIRYVNIETRLGNAAAQRNMLEWIETNLP
jgi:hypothetical protein